MFSSGAVMPNGFWALPQQPYAVINEVSYGAAIYPEAVSQASESSGLSDGEIAGVVVGTVAGAVALAAAASAVTAVVVKKQVSNGVGTKSGVSI